MNHTSIQKALHRHQWKQAIRWEEIWLVEEVKKIDELLSDRE